jgi:adenylyltransferase/sulfurtransferase
MSALSLTGLKVIKMIHPSEEISPQTLKALLASDRDLTLIDVRGSYEWTLGRLRNSINIPLEQLLREKPWKKLWDAMGIIKNTRIVFYCHLGVRSHIAMVTLKQEGFTNISHLKGGLDAWNTSIESIKGE